MQSQLHKLIERLICRSLLRIPGGLPEDSLYLVEDR
jgi:hypothetical protein